MANKTVRISGYDAAGLPRVWGEHETADVAETRCRDEAAAYVRRRPDTGPLAKWTFHTEQQVEAYAEYCEAKAEIDEMPLTIAEFEELNRLADAA